MNHLNVHQQEIITKIMAYGYNGILWGNKISQTTNMNTMDDSGIYYSERKKLHVK